MAKKKGLSKRWLLIPAVAKQTKLTIGFYLSRSPEISPSDFLFLTGVPLSLPQEKPVK